MILTLTVTKAKAGRVSISQWASEPHTFEYASPLSPSIFHRPRVSERWMGELAYDQMNKILATRTTWEEFNDIEVHDWKT